MQRQHPSDNDIIGQILRRSPRHGKKSLKILFKLTSTSLVSKLQLLSRLLQEHKEKTAAFAVSLLRADSTAIINNLPQLILTLTYRELDVLINFLIDHKIFPATHKPDLYYDLAHTYYKSINVSGEIYFLKQALALPNTSWTKRHDIHLLLAKRYSEGPTGEQKNEILQHFKAAHTLETTGKVDSLFILTDGVVSNFLKTLARCTQDHFTQSALRQLRTIQQLIPDDPRIIQMITEYVDRAVIHLQQSFDGILLKTLLDLAEIIPPLKDKVPAILEFVENAPKEVYAFGHKAHYFYIFKRYDQAAKFANKALQEDPTDPNALFSLGTSLHQLQQYKASLSPFLSLLKQADLPLINRLQAYHRLSAAYLALGNCVLAIKYAEEAIRLNTTDVAVYINRITATFELGETKHTKKLLAEAKKRFPSSKLIDICQTQLFPHHESLELEEKAPCNTILCQIYTHIDHRQYDEAHHKAVFLLGRETDKAFPHLALAAVHEVQRNYAASLEHLLAAKDGIEPLTITSRMMRVYRHLKQYSLAEEQAWFILHNKENTSKLGCSERMGAISTLLLIYNNNENYKKGVEKITEALNLKGLLDLEKQRLYYNLVVLHHSHRDFDAAIACAKQAIVISPQQVPADIYYLLGHSYYLDNKHQLAIEPLQKFLKIKPRDTNAHLILGYVYHFDHPSFSTKAINYFSQALALDPSCIIQLTTVLPESIIEQLQGQDGSFSETKGSVGSIYLPLEEKGKNKSAPTTSPPHVSSAEAIVSSSSTALSLSSLSLAERKTVQPSLSAEQLAHRLFQAEKKRQQYQLERQLLADEDNEEKRKEGWNIPDYGFLNSNDPLAPTIAFKGRSKSDSHLHAFLHSEQLKKSCSPELLTEWQRLLLDGGMVGKKGEGIRILNAIESAKVTARIGKKDRTYVAKVKSVTFFGDCRGYAWLIEGREKLLCFDAAIKKSHSK